ncbi:MAG: ABC transporter substrate-binding protein [Pseudomonadota bacterium]
MRLSNAIAFAVGLAFAGPAAAEAPGAVSMPKVVSMNVCTDQLAMLVAGPDQILSLSHLARDPSQSAMAIEALRFGVNHGRAEEIFLAAPDVVLASTFSNPATIAMLRRVGVEVIAFPPAQSLADIPDRLAQMGEVLKRPAAAAERIAAFETDLAALPRREGVRAALYGPGGYYRGPRTLAGDILNAAGLATVSDTVGRDVGGFVSLEEMVMAAPDLLITPDAPNAPSRSHAVLEHPALGAVTAERAFTNRNWVCGTPAVLDAARALIE